MGKLYHRIRVHFVRELLGEPEQEMLLKPFAPGWCCYEEQFQMEWYFHALEECGSYGKDLQDIAISARLLSILTKIFAICQDASGTLRGKEGQAREIIRYINEHLKDPLTLEGLAGTFYMSKNHLTSIFKRATGTTVARYILYKRMAVVRGNSRQGYRRRKRPPMRVSGITPAFSAHIRRCSDARPRTKEEPDCLRWIKAGISDYRRKKHKKRMVSF